VRLLVVEDELRLGAALRRGLTAEGFLVDVATDPRRADANARALAAMLAVQATLVDVAPASEVLGLERGQFLHAGPPIEWSAMCGPMRGAAIGALLFEGWASTAEEAQTLAAQGGVRFAPCHHLGAVGPMAGLLSPSMAVVIVSLP